MWSITSNHIKNIPKCVVCYIFFQACVGVKQMYVEKAIHQKTEKNTIASKITSSLEKKNYIFKNL